MRIRSGRSLRIREAPRLRHAPAVPDPRDRHRPRCNAARQAVQRPAPPPSPVPAREETPITRERRENVQRGSDRSTATNIATRVISGVGATFQSPAAMGGGLISSLGGIVGEGLSLIPGVGGFLGGVTTAVANVMAGIFTTSVEKAMEAQKRTIPYAQTMGVSAGQANLCD